jgi:hypothetical protein
MEHRAHSPLAIHLRNEAIRNERAMPLAKDHLNQGARNFYLFEPGTQGMVHIE